MAIIFKRCYEKGNDNGTDLYVKIPSYSDFEIDVSKTRYKKWTVDNNSYIWEHFSRPKSDQKHPKEY